jgi:low temperature requirement protein LtrA
VPSAPSIRLHMYARSIDDPHRTSSELELLFDLTFVVAVSAVTERLTHDVATGHGLTVALPFLQVFFAIWWAWMNFTWFASSYDTDDVAYRLLTMLQMAGVLVLAAGAPAAISSSDYLGVTVGYVIMRTGLVALWLRAGIEYRAGRQTALRYACGVGVLQLLWIVRLVLVEANVLPSAAGFPVFACLVALELSVPLWAERAGATTWHPHHIAERYSLFTIILFGEGILAASVGVRNALGRSHVSVGLIGVGAAGFVLICALWWLYYLEPTGDGLVERRDRSYRWGYGHFGVFAALAALGSGLQLAVEQTAHHVNVSPLTTGYAVATPASAFVLLLWLVHRPIVAQAVVRPGTTLSGAATILVLPLGAGELGVPNVVALIAAVSSVLVADTLMQQREAARRR